MCVGEREREREGERDGNNNACVYVAYPISVLHNSKKEKKLADPAGSWQPLIDKDCRCLLCVIVVVVA